MTVPAHPSLPAPRPGAFVCVVGPSGVGKDSLIAGAQRLLLADVEFPRRVVTRPSSEFEEHDSLSREAFLALEQAGQFALSWHAHGLCYGIPQEVAAKVRQGRIAVCNVSRAAIPGARQAFAHVSVVNVTAPADVVQARLLARGRESAEAIRARIQHEGSLARKVEADLTICNDRSLDEGVAVLVDFLRRLGQPGTTSVGERLQQ